MQWLKDIFRTTYYFEYDGDWYTIYRKPWWRKFGIEFGIQTTDRKYAVYLINKLNGINNEPELQTR